MHPTRHNGEEKARRPNEELEVLNVTSSADRSQDRLDSVPAIKSVLFLGKTEAKWDSRTHPGRDAAPRPRFPDSTRHQMESPWYHIIPLSAVWAFSGITAQNPNIKVNHAWSKMQSRGRRRQQH